MSKFTVEEINFMCVLETQASLKNINLILSYKNKLKKGINVILYITKTNNILCCILFEYLHKLILRE